MKHTKHKKQHRKINITQKSYKSQKGGDLAIINDYNNINLFTDEEMEQHMNPIYGYIMSNIGFIPNIFYLAEIEAINTKESEIITKTCNVIPGNFQPINEIKKLSPKQIGNYIAMKYIIKKHPELNVYKSEKQKTMIEYKNTNKAYPFNMILNKFIPLQDYNNERIFHLILFCLWWVLQNDEGIKEYYKGINETFDFINKLKIDEIKYELINISNIPTDNSIRQQPTFEAVIHNFLNPKFILYNYEIAKNFCKENRTYADCGETTMRNLINLLCFDDDKLNISLLEKYNPIQPLKDFYMKFDTFQKQSINNKEELNARDAWSKLIIEHGSNNINFAKKCINGEHNYDLMSGMNLDGTKENFLQLLQNLLPGIEKWDDLLSEKITKIKDNTKNGIGNILIEHTIVGNVTLYLQEGHYHIDINSTNNEDKRSYENFNVRKNGYISFLKDKKYLRLNENNYLDYNIQREILQHFIEKNKDSQFTEKLLILSLTDKYDSDLRRRIKIDELYIDLLNKYPKANSKLNEYTYTSNDFEFVNKLPNLTHLNFFPSFSNKKTIDLSPLKNIQSIGDFFLSGTQIEEIYLTPLQNVKSIGYGFLSNTEIQKIDLTPLQNIQSIGHFFLYNTKIQQIDLTPLQNIQSIGHRFLSNTQIQEIKLTPLKNVQSIGNNFLSNTQIQEIDLTPLEKVQSIGDYFLSNTQIQEIDLTPLENIQSIGDNFFSNTQNLKEIDLRYSKNLKLFYNPLINGRKQNSYITITKEQKNNLTKEEIKKLLSLKINIQIGDTSSGKTYTNKPKNKTKKRK